MKALRISTIIILLIVAVNALLAGYSMITDSSGTRLQMPVSWLQHSPFSTYLIPGIILFITNGVLNLVAAVFTIFQWKNYPALIVWQGIILIGWIVIQVIMLQTFIFLHGLLLGIGFWLFIFGIRLSC